MSIKMAIRARQRKRHHQAEGEDCADDKGTDLRAREQMDIKIRTKAIMGGAEAAFYYRSTESDVGALGLGPVSAL